MSRRSPAPLPLSESPIEVTGRKREDVLLSRCSMQLLPSYSFDVLDVCVSCCQNAWRASNACLHSARDSTDVIIIVVIVVD